MAELASKYVCTHNGHGQRQRSYPFLLFSEFKSSSLTIGGTAVALDVGETKGLHPASTTNKKH